MKSRIKDAFKVAGIQSSDRPQIAQGALAKGVPAHYQPWDDTLAVSSTEFPDSTCDHQVKVNWWAQPNPILHELGHRAHYRSGEKRQRTRTLTPVQKKVALEVSGYAATNKIEFVAETWAGHKSGKRYSAGVYKLFDKITKGGVKL